MMPRKSSRLGSDISFKWIMRMNLEAIRSSHASEKKESSDHRRSSRRVHVYSHEWDKFRKAVFARDNFTCQYCGDRGVRLECDHVVPIAKGGLTDMGNLVTACFVCNRSKGAKLLSEWNGSVVK